MGDLNEIVTVTGIERLFGILVIILPVVSVISGIVIGKRRKQLRSGLAQGLCWGMIGPLNWVLWRLYTTITNYNGLDTVRNLAINFVVFVLIGIGFGVGYAYFSQSNNGSVSKAPLQDERSVLQSGSGD